MLNEISRRPIALRTAGWSRLLAYSLDQAGFTPNQVSLMSICFAAIGSILLLISIDAAEFVKMIYYICCAACIQSRLLCNMLDGLIAVEGGKQSKIGILFNEIPDRIADTLLLVTAGYASGSGSAGIALGWSAALLAIFTAYIRAFGVAQGLQQDFCGPMAKPQRMATLTIIVLLAALESALAVPHKVVLFGLLVIVLGTFITCVQRVWHLAKKLESTNVTE